MSSGTIRACVFLCSRKPNLVIDLRNFLQATKNGRDIEQALAAIKHVCLVGVSDPTGFIPRGLVFLTGFGDRAPSRMFLTRVSVTHPHCPVSSHLYWMLSITFG